MAFAFIMSMPGCPFVYAGDEIGMRHLDVTSVEGGYQRTGARSPMQWDATEPNFGFSDAQADELYTPQDLGDDAPTVAAQMADDSSLWHEVQRLATLRREVPALGVNASVDFVYVEKNAYPLIYLRAERGEGGQRVLCALNPSGRPVEVPCGFEPARELYALGERCELTDGVLRMPAESATFFELRM